MQSGREYVRRMREQGYSEEQIRAALSESGWAPEQIDGLLGAAAPRQRARRPSKSGTHVWVLVGLGCLGASVFIGAILAAILFPVFARAREKARQTSCMSNLKQIDLAHMMYAQDNGQAVAPSADWPTRLYPYLNNEALLQCPSDQRATPHRWERGPLGYTMSDGLRGWSLQDMRSPNEVAVFFDGTRMEGGRDAAAMRHNMGLNVGYADGHVKWVSEDAWPQTCLDPGAP